MRIKYFERVLILMMFNIYKITGIVFIVSLFLSFIICNFYNNLISLIIGYIFWFSFGAFSFSLVIRKSNTFLQKKSEDKNTYYLNLLNNKYMAGQLRITHRKEKI